MNLKVQESDDLCVGRTRFNSFYALWKCSSAQRLIASCEHTVSVHFVRHTVLLQAQKQTHALLTRAKMEWSCQYYMEAVQLQLRRQQQPQKQILYKIDRTGRQAQSSISCSKMPTCYYMKFVRYHLQNKLHFCRDQLFSFKVCFFCSLQEKVCLVLLMTKCIVEIFSFVSQPCLLL